MISGFGDFGVYVFYGLKYVTFYCFSVDGFIGLWIHGFYGFRGLGFS